MLCHLVVVHGLVGVLEGQPETELAFLARSVFDGEADGVLTLLGRGPSDNALALGFVRKDDFVLGVLHDERDSHRIAA